jgi:large subunit ribosomal protein L43
MLTKYLNVQNGVGAFILQCKRIDFHYCDWAGSSRGMK